MQHTVSILNKTDILTRLSLPLKVREGKDQESIPSSITRDRGHHMGE